MIPRNRDRDTFDGRGSNFTGKTAADRARRERLLYDDLHGVGAWYHEVYLNSPAWQAISRIARIRDGMKCTTCGATDNLSVHHKRYRHEPTDVRLDDLITLCQTCHKAEHAKPRPPRKQPKKPPTYHELDEPDPRYRTNAAFVLHCRTTGTAPTAATYDAWIDDQTAK